MGCISSKNAKSASSPVHHHHNDSSVVISVRDVSSRNLDSCSNSHSSSSTTSSLKSHIIRSGGGFGPLEKIKEEPEKEKEKDDGEESAAVRRNRESGNSKPSKRAAFSIKFGRLVEGEHIAAGWPAWLSAVAGEAIDGWLPLRSDTFERLEKIGQGTYSSVYRARDVETGRMMALKKVRFDNFQPESVRFMAREITILRRLDHPNVMKLEGLITSRLSCSIYFVFEYMEHDLSGLLSCPDIKFSDSQVEQLHKIFKLCGSPPDEYWKKSKLPLANMFKPQQAYESALRERCKELPKTAVNLIDTFLSIEPHKRGTATSALDSEYFTTKPYACEPSSLPKYPPNKEIDAKFREEARRQKAGGRARATRASRNPRRVLKTSQEPTTFCKVVPTEEVEAHIRVAHRGNGHPHLPKVKGATECRGFTKAPYDTMSEASQASEVTEASQADSIRSVPVQITASSDFAWAKRRKHDASHTRSRQNENVLYPTSVQALDSQKLESEEFRSRVRSASRGRDEIARRSMQRQQSLGRHDSFDSYDINEAQELSEDYHEQQERIHLSGPMLSQSHRHDGRQESHTHQIRRSRFYRDV